ncbi:MAG TPA: VWA domain-containing protein [Gemmatimonadales bacterium]|nr:VWA domain-containing protein [Gemmatimonadales bacterium]
MARRALHFIWIVDTSGSMAEGGKIQALNHAAREVLPHMRRIADEQPHARVLVRVLTFSSGAQWVVEEPTPIEEFAWSDVEAGGLTDLGEALKMLASQMAVPPMESRALPPVLVLISDGQPTDDFEDGLEALMAQPWGKRAVRIAIAIGRDADDDVLRRFIGDARQRPLHAHSAEQLVDLVRWASTVIGPVSEPSGERSKTIPEPPDPAQMTW